MLTAYVKGCLRLPPSVRKLTVLDTHPPRAYSSPSIFRSERVGADAESYGSSGSNTQTADLRKRTQGANRSVPPQRNDK